MAEELAFGIMLRCHHCQTAVSATQDVRMIKLWDVVVTLASMPCRCGGRLLGVSPQAMGHGSRCHHCTGGRSQDHANGERFATPLVAG